MAKNEESPQTSFGAWLKTQRRKHRLTQTELAQQVSCATITIRKIEADTRRPSKQLAELLADYLGVAPESHAAFLDFASPDHGCRWEESCCDQRHAMAAAQRAR